MIKMNGIPAEVTPVFNQLLVDQNPDALWEEWEPASTQQFIDEIFHVPDEEEGDPQPEDIEQAEEPHIVPTGDAEGELVYLDGAAGPKAESYDLPTVPMPTFPNVRPLRDRFSA